MMLNSVPSVPSADIGNTRPISPAKRWCFTLNNYNLDEIKDIELTCSSDGYFMKEEISKSGTPHLQGVVIFEKKCRPKNKFISKRIHWEKMRGTPVQALLYCMKEDTRKPFGKSWFANVLKYFGDKQALLCQEFRKLRPWQNEVLEILASTPHMRDIWYIYEKLGGAGKSLLQKYILSHYNAIIVAGNRSDMKNAIIQYYNLKKKYAEIILLNVPKSSKNLSWSAIEEIKDGVLYSGKYEGGMAIFPRPHVFIFSNHPPPIQDGVISADKFKVRRLYRNIKAGIYNWTLVNENAIAIFQRKVKVFLELTRTLRVQRARLQRKKLC